MMSMKIRLQPVKHSHFVFRKVKKNGQTCLSSHSWDEEISSLREDGCLVQVNLVLKPKFGVTKY